MISVDLFLNICEYLNYDEFEVIVLILFPNMKQEVKQEVKQELTLLFIQRKTKIEDFETLKYICKLISLSQKPTNNILEIIGKDDIFKVYYLRHKFGLIESVYIDNNLKVIEFCKFRSGFSGMISDDIRSFIYRTRQKDFYKYCLLLNIE